MPFKKGEPRPLRSGRRKGTPNKINSDIFNAFLSAAAEWTAEKIAAIAKAQGLPVPDSPQDLKDYFKRMLDEHPEIAFSKSMDMVVKAMPLMIQANVVHEQPNNAGYTIEQLRALPPTELAKLHGEEDLAGTENPPQSAKSIN